MAITNKRRCQQNDVPLWHKVVGVFSMIMILCLGACSPKHSSYSEFKNVPADGWSKNEPLTFTPDYGDSTLHYDIAVVVCYEHDYNYRNIGLCVDFIKDCHLVSSEVIDADIADKYGNWSSPGFGTSYQFKTVVKRNVSPSDVSKIVLWMGLKCDELKDVSKVGILLTPAE